MNELHTNASRLPRLLHRTDLVRAIKAGPPRHRIPLSPRPDLFCRFIAYAHPMSLSPPSVETPTVDTLKGIEWRKCSGYFKF